MEDIILNLKALAAMKNMSIEKLAEECDIKPSHLKAVSVGKATMTATDLLALAKYTGVNPFNIQTKY